ncbi:unnamed protein product [Rhizophagus irregularis]|uniref:Uncharacterized protein n=1 Tax=Rhizophagus irregularis TaxID=588596 RepID=A0A2I1GIZ9_9GLOM|nr:hypothetical protein RhiirA4_461498 [Rhizophagus irregularis]CAB4420442.1 unnamed protein product [Rhizophagus irregularis]
MFIAFMGGVYSEAHIKGHAALLRFRAELISDYEALDEIHFNIPLPEPKYIYYIGKSESYEEWDTDVKKYHKEKSYNDYEKKMGKRELIYKDTDDDDDDNNDDDDKDNNKDNIDDDDDDDESEDEDEDEDVIGKVKLLSDKVKEEFKWLKEEIGEVKLLKEEVEEVISLKKEIKLLNSKIDKLLNNKNTDCSLILD